MQAVPGLLHVVESGNANSQLHAARTLYLLSGVAKSLLQQLATPVAIGALALRAWHGKPDVQAVALLLLRDLSRSHTEALLAAKGDALPLMIALEGSPTADVAQIARDALSGLAALPAVQQERAVQVSLRPM